MVSGYVQGGKNREQDGPVAVMPGQHAWLEGRQRLDVKQGESEGGTFEIGQGWGARDRGFAVPLPRPRGL